jgi:light-regulated signal transduction histidine kinase (bacteriophytochrome)
MIPHSATTTVERNRAGETPELREVQAQLERRTAELEQSRRAFEQLASTVSHDLSQPLTTIAGFADLLRRRYEGQLDSDADEFIAFILKGTDRMQAMIDDLVSYLRTAQEEPPATSVDCSRVLQTVIASLATPIEEKEAALTAEPLPVVRGDAHQLGQLFSNLISNALEFSNGTPPRVNISFERMQDGICFSVADNGIGIEAGQAKRAFELFQRLHSSDSHTGNGVGLAICKKIVERHGGRIWVEPGSEGGSIFRFTLPSSGSVSA